MYICMHLHTSCFYLVIAILSLNSLDINYNSYVILLDFFYENAVLVVSLFSLCLFIFELCLHLRIVLQIFVDYLLEWN